MKVIVYLLIGLLPFCAYGQDRRLLGRVADNAGDPVAEATVVLAGMDRRTTTDRDMLLPRQHVNHFKAIRNIVLSLNVPLTS